MTDTRYFRSDKTQEEIIAAAAAFSRDRSGPPPPPKLTDEDLRRITRSAALSLQLAPLPPGDNDGRVYYRDADVLAFDAHGHEAFAEFISNAQAWVLRLISDLEEYRRALLAIARDVHAPDCHRVAGDDVLKALACDCHRDYAREVLAE